MKHDIKTALKVPFLKQVAKILIFALICKQFNIKPTFFTIFKIYNIENRLQNFTFTRQKDKNKTNHN